MHHLGPPEGTCEEMYAAKQEGTARHVIYNEGIWLHKVRLFLLAACLRRTILNNVGPVSAHK